MADARVALNTIAHVVGCSLDTVRRWIGRAKGADGLRDRARSGRPATYPQEVRVRIIAFDCQTRPLPDSGRWTRRWAARRLQANETIVGAAPAKSTLHRILQSNRLKPHHKRIVIHYTPYHGSWLNWIEFWFGIMGRKVLDESFGSPEAIKTAPEAFAGDWNTLLAHPFHWTYDGRGLHEKAVQRFTKMLHCSAAQMELRIPTKQMRLLTNLLRDYDTMVSDDTWAQFAAALRSQSDTITAIIEAEEGPTRKLNAQQALAGLNEALHDAFASTEPTTE